jgi:transposase
VHKETVVACVRLSIDGKTAREFRRFATSTTGLQALLAWLTGQGCTHVAMEATGVSWKPVWNILSDGAFALIVANAAHIRNVPGRKSDVNDATWIADLLACGLVRASFIPEQEIQELRALLRARAAHPRTDPSCPAAAEDAGRGQHQARFGDQRHRGRERPADGRGHHRR